MQASSQEDTAGSSVISRVLSLPCEFRGPQSLWTSCFAPSTQCDHQDPWFPSLPPGISLQAISWSNCRGLLIGFPSLTDRHPALPEVQRLEVALAHILLNFFFIVSSGSMNLTLDTPPWLEPEDLQTQPDTSPTPSRRIYCL